MKGAIASVEIFGFPGDASPRQSTSARPLTSTRPPTSVRRFTLTIGAPTRSPSGDGWECRVSLADLHRPQSVTGTDSVEALATALEVGRGWVSELREGGFELYRDRAGQMVFEGV